MKLKDALALVKLPPVARQSVQTRMVGLLKHQQAEYGRAFKRLLSQVPQHAQVGWEYRHSVLRGKSWNHVFQNIKNRWERTLLATAGDCDEDDFSEIMVIVAYFCEDMIPRSQVVVFRPIKGKVEVWPVGSLQYKAVMQRLLSVQTDRVQEAAKTHVNFPL
jgi:hypothetical protein